MKQRNIKMKDYNYATLAEYYDTLESNEGINKFNKVLDKLLKRFKVKSVLDITCGTGAQSIYLHKKGYKVTASDYSKKMVSVAQKKYKKLKFQQGDIRTAKYGKFDAVISIFNAIGHLSKNDFEKAIRNISENLKENGIYIFDIFNLGFMKKNFISYEFIDTAREVNGFKFARFNKNKFDKKKGLMTINQKIYIQKELNKPKIFKESWDLQIYSPEQLRKIMERNGFKIVKFLDINGKKFDKEKSLFILIVARKKIS